MRQGKEGAHSSRRTHAGGASEEPFREDRPGHLAAQVCRDAQQGSIASAVELCGTLCALYISLPLIRSLLAIVEQLL